MPTLLTRCLVVLVAVELLLVTGCDPNRNLAAFTCDDGVCDPGENPTNCSEDCPPNVCGNNVCDLSEDGSSCPEDCRPTTCGDGDCDAPMENPSKCPEDCQWTSCGNGVCEAGEDNACVDDCFADLCGNNICDFNEDPGVCPSDCTATTDVDLLFVIDDSGSMAGEQMTMRANFYAFYQMLRNSVGALPDLHVGVTSTNLGTGMFETMFCEDGGDGGDLLAAPAAALTGANWMIDRIPLGCTITRDTTGACTAHNCDASHCPEDGAAPLALVVDAESGCPRCRNYPDNPEQTFSALGDLGTMGCGYEQPLEAMKMALDNNLSNTGFLRPDALLAVVILTDEDDCSASNPQLFDNTQNDINSTLGPMGSFRCFEFGITCDINARTHTGTRQNCMPRDDAASLLYPISRYTNFLYSLKDPGELILSLVAGPTLPSPDGVGFNVVVGLDQDAEPDVQFSCTTAVDGATPAVRLRTLLEHVMAPMDIGQYADTSICSADYTPALEGLADYIRSRLGQ